MSSARESKMHVGVANRNADLKKNDAFVLKQGNNIILKHILRKESFKGT